MKSPLLPPHLQTVLHLERIGVGDALGNALLGVGHLDLIDHEELSQSNRNRYVGVWHGDPIPGSKKVDLGHRLAKLIDPSVGVSVVRAKFPSDSALKALRGADYVFGCVDSDGVRFVLNEACLAYRKPLFDLASDVPEPGCYGGRVHFVGGDKGCLYCRKVLDPVEVRRVPSPQSARENEAAVYGIDQRALDEAGPSVEWCGCVSMRYRVHGGGHGNTRAISASGVPRRSRHGSAPQIRRERLLLLQQRERKGGRRRHRQVLLRTLSRRYGGAVPARRPTPDGRLPPLLVRDRIAAAVSAASKPAAPPTTAACPTPAPVRNRRAPRGAQPHFLFD